MLRKNLFCSKSNTLSDTQKNYSHTHRGNLTITFALTNFHNYVYGEKLIAVTDHHAIAKYLEKNKNQVYSLQPDHKYGP